MKFIYNALSGVAAALALVILALLLMPDLFAIVHIDAADRLPLAAGLLALCALVKPYVAERALLALVRRHSER